MPHLTSAATLSLLFLCPRYVPYTDLNLWCLPLSAGTTGMCHSDKCGKNVGKWSQDRKESGPWGLNRRGLRIWEPAEGCLETSKQLQVLSGQPSSSSCLRVCRCFIPLTINKSQHFTLNPTSHLEGFYEPTIQSLQSILLGLVLYY